MLRLIHTADWHIGLTLAGYTREAEHRAVLARLVAIAAEREADAMIIAGDVFDTQNPSGEAQQLYYETLMALHRARPGMTIVVIAGNHDAAGRIAAPRALLSAFGVHVIGNAMRTGDAIDIAHHLVPLLDRRGEVAAHVLALSYPSAACLRSLTRLDGEAGSPVVRATAELYADAVGAARPRLAGLPLVLTGHLHVAGGLESDGAERRILVGGQHAVPPDVFPAEATYVALGHLHKAQGIGRETIRYSGSLFPLSASEQAYRHGVTLLTLDDGGRADIEHIEIARPVPFLRLPAAGEIRLDDLGDHLAELDLAPDLGPALWPFVDVRLAREGLPAGYRAEVDRIAESFKVRLVRAAPPPREDAMPVTAADEPIVALSERLPRDLFIEAFEMKHGRRPDADHLDAFHVAEAEA